VDGNRPEKLDAPSVKGAKDHRYDTGTENGKGEKKHPDSEREPAHPLHQIAIGRFGVTENLFLIETAKLAIAHDDVPVNDHGLHVAGFGTVSDLTKQIVHRLIMDRSDID